jgi:hypothetical protein
MRERGCCMVEGRDRRERHEHLGVSKWGSPLGVGRCGDQLVVGVQEGSDLVDLVLMVWLQVDLSSKRPGTLDSWIISKGAEQRVIGSCQIFID